MLKWIVVAAVLALPTLALAEARYALVIGSNPGWSQDRPLRYAENDAERIRDVLVGYGGFTPERVTLLRDPTTSDVRAELRRLATVARDSRDGDTLVFLYYSGHADDKFLHLRGSPLAFSELQDTLRALPSTIKLGVIDACKSGAVTHKGGAAADEFSVDVAAPKLSGMVLLASSGADELSQESRALAGSVFTHHLVSGLRGAADEDDDRQVTIGEAYHYAYSRTRATTSSGTILQRPAFRYELSGQGELVLTTLKAKSNVAMIVPKGEPQKYVVLDQHEWRVIAEATAEKAKDIIVSVSPGTYKVKRVLPDRLEVASAVVAAGDRTDLGKLAFATQPLSSGVAKGDPNTLTPQEQHEWRRTEALRLLNEGQAQAALVMFDELLRHDAADLSSWRGRGRAMVRLAEAYQRVGDLQREKRAIGEALRSDPALSEDPLFQIWYQRLFELEARDKSIADKRRQIDEENRKNPRGVRTFGLGFDVFAGRGLFAVSGTMVIKRHLFTRVAFAPAYPGVDASLVIAPLSSKWSPFVGVGGHVTAKNVGLSDTPVEPGDGDMAEPGASPYSWDEMYSNQVRLEVGGQFVGSSGFMMELGVSIINFKSVNDGRVTQVLPAIHFGWLW